MMHELILAPAFMSSSSKSEEQVEMTVVELTKKLDEFEEHISPVIKKSLPEVFSKLSAVEIAKLEIALAFALDSLMFSNASLTFAVYLKLQGISTQDHAVVRELVFFFLILATCQIMD